MKNEIAVLLQKSLISDEKAKVLKSHDVEAPFSVFWELRSLLYVGITFFTTGIGILIYQHIEGIGHSILLLHNNSVFLRNFLFERAMSSRANAFTTNEY